MQSMEIVFSEVKTPAFVYCLETLSRSKTLIQNTIDQFGRNNWIAYSYKTNPLLAEPLVRMGCAMQVTSPMHLREIQRFTSPEILAKSFYCSGSLTVEDAVEVLQAGLYVVVDSETQLLRVEEAASKIRVSAKVLIRVDAGQSASESPFGTSGMLQGIDLQKLPQVLAVEHEWVKVVGIHNHFGSQVTSFSAWKQNIENLAAVLRDLAFPIEILNLGGGTPISYDGVNAPSIEEIYAKSMASSIRSIQEIHPSLRIVVEPGRYIVGPCGYLVATVTNLHRSNDRDGVNLDVSLFAGFQDRFLSNLTFQFPVSQPLSGTARTETILRGSSPASIDYFGIYSSLPKLQLGDRVVFGMAGAYASSMGSNFSGVVRPSEYTFAEGIVEKICDAR
ncbi:diaminopimelate decarboxylase family protein [Pseudomonas alloputida]|uniref:diaminopimelate decarboxylase family protein n=1 Tax=Pseudomonas TaxID=286 RepID=UPI003EEB388A